MDLVRNIVSGSVDFGDDNLIGVVLVQGSELIVFGGESFAVAAPRGVEFEENILVVVKDDFIVVLCYHNCDRAFLLLWDGLALDAGIDLAADVVSDEGADALGCDGSDVTGLSEGELQVLARVLDGEGWPLANLKIEVAGVLAEGFGVNGSEVDLALVLLSDGFEGLRERFAVLFALGENVSEWDAGLKSLSERVHMNCNSTLGTHLHVVGICLRANLTNQWRGTNLGEGGNVIGGKLILKNNLALIKALVQSDTRLLHAFSFCEIGIRSGSEKVVVPQFVSNLLVGGVARLVVSGKEANECNLVGGLELFQCGGGLEEGDGRKGLFGHV